MITIIVRREDKAPTKEDKRAAEERKRRADKQKKRKETLYEEFTRLAETRLAQNTLNYIKVVWITLT